MQFRFIVGPSIYWGSSPCAGLQVVTQSTHLSKECNPPTGFKPTPFRNSASKVAGLQVHATIPKRCLSCRFEALFNFEEVFAPDQMFETKLLQMCLFSIIFTSLHYFKLSFSLLFYVISTYIIKFPPWFPVLPAWFHTFFAFQPTFPAFPRWFPEYKFPSHSSYSNHYSPHFLHYLPPIPQSVFYT